MDWLTFVFITIFFTVIFGLWAYYDRRDDSTRTARAKSSVFHCKICGNIYKVIGVKTEATCPKCEQGNLRLRF